MSAHVLLNLLNELRKRDKILSILFLFCKEFTKFNNTGAGMIDSIYQRILKLIKNPIFGTKMSRFCQALCYLIIDMSLPKVTKSVNH